jgi:hypothetical protein
LGSLCVVALLSSAHPGAAANVPGQRRLGVS